MSAQFQINFRREAFRRERTEARRRVVRISVWLTYFGALSVMLGLYGLNCAALEKRTQQLDRQLARQRSLRQGGTEWIASAAEVAAVEPWVADAGRWRDLLGALPRLVPEGARLTGIQFNPDGVTGGDRKLLLDGVMRVDSMSDGTAGVTDFVAVIARDSLFASQFRSVRLVSTRAREGGNEADFQVECR
jgi:Tfp pilus assembly protein PilN